MLVQDLARLLVAPIVYLLALIARQHAQSIGGQPRIQHQRLISSDDGVAPEDGREPGNAGGDDVLTAVRDLQGVEVTGGALQRSVELIITATKAGGMLLPGVKGMATVAQASAEIGAMVCEMLIALDKCLDDGLKA